MASERIGFWVLGPMFYCYIYAASPNLRSGWVGGGVGGGHGVHQTDYTNFSSELKSFKQMGISKRYMYLQ